jgi:hypothetical protein
MSVDLLVFLKREKLPTRDDWQRAIDGEGFDLTLDDVDTLSHTGFWPAKLNGKNCGFEYSFEKNEPLELDDEPLEPDAMTDAIADRDYCVTFTIHGSVDELQAASVAGAVLAKSTDGVFVDPQSGEFATGAGAFQLLQDQERQEHERRMEVATKKWANVTKRRCPKCNAPCPEFRPTCSVCGYEIGRA